MPQAKGFVMSMKKSNLVLMAILDKLSKEMGDATLTLCFEDLDLDRSFESHFDIMCLWAINEGLMTIANESRSKPSHTDTSYMKLKAPCLTSFGIAVGSLAVNSMNGDIILATAVIKYQDVAAILKPEAR